MNYSGLIEARSITGYQRGVRRQNIASVAHNPYRPNPLAQATYAVNPKYKISAEKRLSHYNGAQQTTFAPKWCTRMEWSVGYVMKIIRLRVNCYWHSSCTDRSLRTTA